MSTNLNQKPIYEITVAGNENPVYRLTLAEWMPSLPAGKSEWSRQEIDEFTLDVFNNEATRKWTPITTMVALDEVAAAPHRQSIEDTIQYNNSIKEFKSAAAKYAVALKASNTASEIRNKAFCQMIADSEKVGCVLSTWQDYRGTTKVEQIIKLFQGKYADMATKDTIKLLEEAEANRIERNKYK